MIEFKYRPDIDGLRALAVVVVMLFHAGLGFSGGYVGVDVFFVISGFLITGLILKEQASGSFRLGEFWIRRIRRILPAATVMVVFVMIAGFFLLLPYDFKDLGKSAIAQQVMLSNIYFSQNVGYFDGPAELMPLLHTWSLAVEEQFYLGFPFLLVFLGRFKKRTVGATLAVIALLSLIASQVFLSRYPSATFFLLPTRAWELLLGGLIWFAPNPEKFNRFVLGALSWISFGAIIVASCAYTSTTQFPGINALLPCSAAAILIYSNTSRQSFPARLLATKPIVFIGLLSYSLYLWHWPILALFRYWNPDPSQFEGAVALGISSIVAWLSWKYVETPFRRGFNTAKPSMVVGAAMLSVVVALGFGSYIYLSHGAPNRFSKQTRKLLEVDHRVPTYFACDVQTLASGNVPRVGIENRKIETVDFVMWGDSHALAASETVSQLAAQYELTGAIIADAGRPPLLGVWKTNTGHSTTTWNDLAMQFIRKNRIKNVLLVARWSILVKGEVNGDYSPLLINETVSSANPKDAAFLLLQSLNRTVGELEELGVNVWIVKQVPLQRGDPLKSMVASTFGGRPCKMTGCDIASHRQRHSTAHEIIDLVSSQHSNVTVLDPAETCFADNGLSAIGDAENCFYADDDHLSPRGAFVLLRPIFRAVFEQLTE